MVFVFNTGVVNVVPVNTALPPLAFVYQFMVAFPSVLLAVKVALIPGQTEAPCALICGTGFTTMLTGVRAADTHPPAFAASA